MSNCLKYSWLMPVLSIIVLLSLAGFVAMTISSIHIHVLPDGRIIAHSHPHEGDDNDSSPASHHSHSGKEYLIYGYLSTALQRIIVIIAVLLLFLHTIVFVYLYQTKPATLENSFYNLSDRAPPHFCL